MPDLVPMLLDAAGPVGQTPDTLPRQGYRNMPESWLSVTEAAAVLGVHARTVERRIGRGELQSRVRPDGRREVLLPEGAAACPTGAGQDAGQVVEVVTAAQEQALRLSGVVVHQANRELDTVRLDLTRARRHAGAAWTVAGLASVLVAVGATWGARELEMSKGQARAADGARVILADALSEARSAAERERVRADRERARGDRLSDELVVRLAELSEARSAAAAQATPATGATEAKPAGLVLVGPFPQ